MILVALAEAARRDELLLVDGGLLRYYRRKDGVSVIREILVLVECRGRGIGRSLVERVRWRHLDAPILARCPASYPANGFWKALGFLLAAEGEINEWRFDPTSSTAPAATPPSHGPP